jgi:hypothetical protein
MKLILLISLFISTLTHANMHLAPPNFDENIFVDFKKANYKLDFNFKERSLIATSVIEFESNAIGYPLVDLVPSPINVVLDGEITSFSTVQLPGTNSVMLRVNTIIGRGKHYLQVTNRIKTNVLFGLRSVASAFWIRDLKDRMFLEQYIPSNLEYDQYQMTFDVNFIRKRKVRQDIYTNGDVTKVNDNRYIIKFPEYYTVSSPYFHTTRKGAMFKRTSTYTSITGREFPIIVYARWPFLKKFHQEAIDVMEELENDYGPWPHKSLVAFNAGLGGMEHSGATMTSFGALDHEMIHSYFAKGVMPANGNSGWIDEAIASWRDRGYPQKTLPGFVGTNMGAHSPYTRSTDRRAYGDGSSFMAYLDYRLSNKGGLKSFLKGYFEAYKHTLITTEHFKNNLEFFLGEDLDQEFNQYVYNNSKSNIEHEAHNPVHGTIRDEDLNQIMKDSL